MSQRTQSSYGWEAGWVQWTQAKPENQAERTTSQGVCILSRDDGQSLKGSELGTDVIRLVFCKDRPLPAMWRHWEEGRRDGEPEQVLATMATDGPDLAHRLVVSKELH